MGTGEPEPFAQLGSRHVGLARSLSLGHCTAGQGGLLHGQWLPCQPSAGLCPLGLLWTSMPRQAAADGHFHLCDLWHNLGIIPQVPKEEECSVYPVPLPGFMLWWLCGHCAPPSLL